MVYLQTNSTQQPNRIKNNDDLQKAMVQLYSAGITENTSFGKELFNVIDTKGFKVTMGNPGTNRSYRISENGKMLTLDQNSVNITVLYATLIDMLNGPTTSVKERVLSILIAEELSNAEQKSDPEKLFKTALKEEHQDPNDTNITETLRQTKLNYPSNWDSAFQKALNSPEVRALNIVR